MADGQVTRRTCGAHDEHRRLLNEDPAYVAARSAIENLAWTYRRGARSPARSGHHPHPGRRPRGVEHRNPEHLRCADPESDRRPQPGLPDDERGHRAGADRLAVRRGRARVEFFLATTDPREIPQMGSHARKLENIIPTGGNPIKSAATGGADPWPADKYLNIWVAPRITSPFGTCLATRSSLAALRRRTAS